MDHALDLALADQRPQAVEVADVRLDALDGVRVLAAVEDHAQPVVVGARVEGDHLLAVGRGAAG